MLPELESTLKLKPASLKKEYSSGDEILDLAQTKTLLRKYKLMIEDTPNFNSTSTETLK
jgi:hypothetical protein